MLWYSAGKPLTAVAVLQLWERGQIGLDDAVGRYLPGWRAGKEAATLRHVLTHTGGFPMLGPNEPFDRELTYAEGVARIAGHQAEWEPGTRACYHPSTGWKVLGAVVEAVDGRPIDRYVTEEILKPAGMDNTRMGIAPSEQTVLGRRLVPVHWKGYKLAVPGRSGVRMVEYHPERIHNEPWHIAKVEPGGGARGPAREPGRFYECLLGYGPSLLDRRSVEMMTAVHRHGLHDRIFGTSVPWGLGVQVAGSLSGRPGRRAFGHAGMASSQGMADPDLGLVFVIVSNGMPDARRAEQRIAELTDAVYIAMGDAACRHRLPRSARADATAS